ncbi:MAG TPA: hypothetical protein VK136_00455 [Bacillota bacterium]|nr:hypothetical protein [Bacillota bacterium]
MVGQAIGSLFAGVMIDLIGFNLTLIIYGFMGVMSILFGPGETKKSIEQV